MTTNPDFLKLTDHFFRHEYSKMVAVISRYFHSSEINLAEDIVQDTLLEAIGIWQLKGIPPDPTAWLYTVAKNKTLNLLKRAQISHRVRKQLSSDASVVQSLPVSEMFSDQRIADDQLRMMFVSCHPALNEKSQIAFILKTLCGLSTSEIGQAFLVSSETINKRLVRARIALRKNNVSISIPNDIALEERLSVILKTIYLLFNEGYNATHGEKAIKNELCFESIRLAEIILSNDKFKNNSKVNALLSLMYLNASRFEARINESGDLIEMQYQNRSKWNMKMINHGLHLLEYVKQDSQLSIYPILATISAVHCTASSYEETDWKAIKTLYEQLATFDHSPIVKLNHAIATAKVKGNIAGIDELLQLEKTQKLYNYSALYTTLAHLYMEEQLFEKASDYLKKAIKLTKAGAQIGILTTKLNACEKNLKSCPYLDDKIVLKINV